MTPSRSPPAASTTSRLPTSGSPGSPSASAASASASAAVAERAGDRDSRHESVAASAQMTAAVSAGAASAVQASVSRLLTEAPQRRAVAGAELGEDPLVEDGRDEDDEREVERDAQLDQRRGPRELRAPRGRARSRRARSPSPGRASPGALRRSRCRRRRARAPPARRRASRGPIAGTSQVSASANATAMPARDQAAASRHARVAARACALTRKREQRGQAERADAEREGRRHIAAARGSCSAIPTRMSA